MNRYNTAPLSTASCMVCALAASRAVRQNGDGRQSATNRHRSVDPWKRFVCRQPEEQDFA